MSNDFLWMSFAYPYGSLQQCNKLFALIAFLNILRMNVLAIIIMATLSNVIYDACLVMRDRAMLSCGCRS